VTPEQEEQVRRALSAAARAEDDLARRASAEDPSQDTGGPATIPADVAARLDTVLEDLLVPRVEADPPRDELAVRRGRRWPSVLVAAAALCVIALAGGAVATGGFGLGGGTGQHSTTGSAPSTGAAHPGVGDSARRPSAPEMVGPSVMGPGHAPSDTGSAPEPSAGRSMAVSAAGPPLRTLSLTHDIQRLVDRARPLPAGLPPGSTCVPPVRHPGEELLGVRLDGRRATLVLGRPENGRQAARVYSCADPRNPAASTTVRTPTR
jgi:hypothetical protein